jgi:predicted Zn-dependent peptidase
MGFTTSITNQHEDFPAMQVLNCMCGGGMTSKLFMNVREKMSLCYSIGSGYYGGKGLVTVSAGIDADKEDTVRQEVLRQLRACADGKISKEELDAAKEAVLSSLRSVMDSPGAIEGYFSTAALSGLNLTLEEYRRRIAQVTLEDVCRAAGSITFHSDFFLEGGAK